MSNRREVHINEKDIDWDAYALFTEYPPSDREKGMEMDILNPSEKGEEL